MGKHAARNILRGIERQPYRPFVYQDLGNMATIGRASAVADFGWMRLKGYLGWLAWLFVHILNLIGFRNRLVVHGPVGVVVLQLPAGDPADHRAAAGTGRQPAHACGHEVRSCATPRSDSGGGPGRGAAALVAARRGLVLSRHLSGAAGRVTSVSNAVPIALLDISVLVLVVVLALGFWRRVRGGGPAARAHVGRRHPADAHGALVFLLFFVLWGLNYRRVPLDQKIEYDQSRVTREAALRLGEHALREVNRLHAAAHRLDDGRDGGRGRASAGAAGSGESDPGSSAEAPGLTLEAAFASAQRMLGSERMAVPGVPKRSLLERYFRVAAIDGMTDPFFLEVILNPDTLPFERPFVLLHEWAHLAGYANESEANFVAWLASTQGDAMARYSGWLAIFEHVVASLPKADRVMLTSQLAAGPRRDLQAGRRPLRPGLAGRPHRGARCLRHVSAGESRR